MCGVGLEWTRWCRGRCCLLLPFFAPPKLPAALFLRPRPGERSCSSPPHPSRSPPPSQQLSPPPLPTPSRGPCSSASTPAGGLPSIDRLLLLFMPIPINNSHCHVTRVFMQEDQDMPFHQSGLRVHQPHRRRLLLRRLSAHHPRRHLRRRRRSSTQIFFLIQLATASTRN